MINIMTVALVITTFNWPSALNLVLSSVANQTRIPDEVLVADDGSNYETQDIIERWADRLPIIHAWLPNVDFRAARARNLALLKATSDYVIMVDGDCLMPHTFIENHLRLKSAKKVIAGNRFLIGVEATAEILAAASSGASLPPSLFQSFKFRYLPLGWLRDGRPRAWKLCEHAIWHYREMWRS
jgi:Glycosyltransferases involved in cell wall biogenesis